MIRNEYRMFLFYVFAQHTAPFDANNRSTRNRNESFLFRMFAKTPEKSLKNTKTTGRHRCNKNFGKTQLKEIVSEIITR